jgi:acetyl-CoA carboxylase biotin carboxyl carrier protein
MLKVQEIREIIKLIDQSSINEFTYESEGTIVSLKKSGGTRSSQAVPVVEPEQKEESLKEETAPVKAETKREENKEVQEINSNDEQKNDTIEIVSPMVGTFYAAPSPETDPYVTKGTTVDSATVVCIVEAMKLFNEIEAEVTGEIVEILVEDGELVEYGQPLFKVSRN